jgi:hypothetical protein
MGGRDDGTVSRCNRVDPWGDLHATSARGMFTGNRGCLVDDDGAIVRHHRSSSLWITCLTEFRGHRHPLAAPHRWTPLFFLDEAVALAAGHRPCACCRRGDYPAYRDAVAAGGAPPPAAELDRRLSAERLRRGRGFSRAGDRPLWSAPIAALPAGTVVVDDVRRPCLVLAGTLQAFSFEGWLEPRPRPTSGLIDVLTPPTSTAALAAGYHPPLHPTAAA